jgi:phage/plasmid-like protein (TIGR03299 family)
MSHEIETFEDGTAAFVSAREDAWHRLGVVVDGAFDIPTAMDVAKLGGWNVRKTALTTSEITPDGVTTLDVPGWYSSTRTNPVTGQAENLGVVGTDYKHIQNEEAADFLYALGDVSGAHLETVGSLRGGREVFFTMKLPRDIVVGDLDTVNLYLAICNSHDGRRAFTGILTPTRIVCANTQAWALASAPRKFTIRHTSGATAQVQQAREKLDMTWRAADAFEAAAERMIQETLAEAEFDEIVKQLWPVAPDAVASTVKRSEERLFELHTLFADADTQKAIRGTRWAGYQAVVEYVDHYATTRGADGRHVQLRAERTALGLTDDVKNQAFALLSV